MLPLRLDRRWCGQDRLAELDATIAVLEKDSAKLQGEVRAKADAALKELRARRGVYRSRRSCYQRPDLEGRTGGRGSKIARQKLGPSRPHATNISKRPRLISPLVGHCWNAKFEARQKVWRESIEELCADSAKLAADQRAVIYADAQQLSF